MKSFSVRWRSVRLHREFEVYAPTQIGSTIMEAVSAGNGLPVWAAGTVWKCPGCGDRTIRTEEFLEGLRRAETWLKDELIDEFTEADLAPSTVGESTVGELNARGSIVDAWIAGGSTAHSSKTAESGALEWIEKVSSMMFGCERDKVYINDDGGLCTFASESYISRI